MSLCTAFFINPTYPAAVVAGNVETSQAITDALYGALGVVGAAQGTMNNFTFGNGRHQYYETVCGGSGAGPGFDGTDAVHTHMTNSKMTDPEILELRFPVVVREFSIRQGSGGAGRHRGGDGVVRRVEFLEPMTANILSNRRRVPPYGANGGEPGRCGENSVQLRSGEVRALAACDQIELGAGDQFVLKTPGGGGYGPAAAKRARKGARKTKRKKETGRKGPAGNANGGAGSAAYPSAHAAITEKLRLTPREQAKW